MQERNLIISFSKNKCRVNGKKGVLKAIRIEEVQENGKTKTLHTDIRFSSDGRMPGIHEVVALMRKPHRKKEAA